MSGSFKYVAFAFRFTHAAICAPCLLYRYWSVPFCRRRRSGGLVKRPVTDGWPDLTVFMARTTTRVICVRSSVRPGTEGRKEGREREGERENGRRSIPKYNQERQ